jgi:hypothetical protein
MGILFTSNIYFFNIANRDLQEGTFNTRDITIDPTQERCGFNIVTKTTFLITVTNKTLILCKDEKDYAEWIHNLSEIMCKFSKYHSYYAK